MATKVKVSWNMRAFRELRTSPEMRAQVAGAAQTLARAAGEGFEATPVEITGGRGRARAAVVTATPRAMASNAKHHTLTRVLKGGA